MRAGLGDAFYMVYFQEPGVADAELARDLPGTFRKLLFSASGDGPGGLPLVPPGGGFLDICADPPALPGWLTEHDISVFAADYAAAGFTGGLNWYRNLDRNWELTAAWHGAPVTVPALYVAGQRDLVVNFPGAREQLPRLREYIPRLRDTVLLPGCGHWTQQERPAEVSDAMIGFLRGLD
jgi:pimeloyl-ACP methyl ester carboxylesterase